MNVRRGLLRLWILLAGLWLIVIAAFSYETLANPYISPRAFYFPKDVKRALAQAELDRKNSANNESWGTFEISTADGFSYTMMGKDGTDAYERLANALPSSPYAARPALVEFYTEEYRALEDGVARNVTKRIQTNDRPEIILYAAANIDRQELARQVSDVQNATANLIETLAFQKRLESLPGIIVAAAAPPTVLLFFGWVVLWVIDGFRSWQS